MGFEVLDVGAGHEPRLGAQADDGRSGGWRADDVLDLDALPEPASDDRGPTAPTWLRGRRMGRVRLGVGLVTVLVTGLVAGSAWAGHVHDRQRAAERSATLAVTALADSWTRVPWTRRPVADVVVRVVNTGPLPVDVVGSTLGDRPRSTRPYVRPLVDGLRVARGDELSISVLQRLDCSSGVPVPLAVPVRTADGVVHQVPVRRGGPGQLVPSQVCDEARPDLGVTARLTGSLRDPVVELRNPSSGTVLVTVETPGKGRPVQVSTTPPVPVDVEPDATLRVGLSVRAPTCVRDAAVVQAAGNLTLEARSLPTMGAPAPQSQSVRLDVSALVGAAMQRACR